ncbi:hypothetical protein [Nocardiopsis nanhaiensis]
MSNEHPPATGESQTADIGEMTPDLFDAQFRAQYGSPLLGDLWARAWDEQYRC